MQKIFNEWESFIFGINNLKKPLWITTIFFNHFVKKNEFDWVTNISKIIKDNEALWGFAKLMIEVNSIDNQAFNIIDFKEWVRDHK